MSTHRIIIMGAAGRDFHNFNVYFRDNKSYEVVAFTATQIPDIEGRVYPSQLAGPGYPQGIPIHLEAELVKLIKSKEIDQVVFAYSDISHEDVMHHASQVLAAGADFRLMGPGTTSLKSRKPVVSVCAVRTGCGKSQTTRYLGKILHRLGKKVVVVRHPMPYGNLTAQAVQRFAKTEDLDLHECTIEEREEYEPHLDQGTIVYAGIDYETILRRAETEADIIIWDGGNNDLAFFKPDLQIVLVDPHRAGHELRYHPGETNLRAADVVIINKIDTADQAAVSSLRRNIQALTPAAVVIEAASPVRVEDAAAIRNKQVLVVEDGPTLTHGEMAYGAGVIAAQQSGAAKIIDPRPYAAGSFISIFEKYPTLGDVLPAMGYGPTQITDLQETINATPCDLVLIGTPINLGALINIKHLWQRVTYDLQEVGQPRLEKIVRDKFG